MVTALKKVPLAVLLAGAFVVGACGGEAESAADETSQRVTRNATLDEAPEPGPAITDRTVDEMFGVEPEVEPELVPREPEPAAPAAEPRQPATRRPEPATRPVEAEPLLERSEPEPEQPEFRPELATPAVPAGAEVTLALEGELSTQESQAGDVFYATVVEDVLASDGMVLVPVGARVRGRVLESRESESSEMDPVLSLSFERLLLDGRELPLDATLVYADIQSERKDSDSRTAAKVAGGAAAGAILGRILGKDGKDALKGAAAGAVAGGAVAAATRSGHATMQQGAELVIRLSEPVRLIAP